MQRTAAHLVRQVGWGVHAQGCCMKATPGACTPHALLTSQAVTMFVAPLALTGADAGRRSTNRIASPVSNTASHRPAAALQVRRYPVGGFAALLLLLLWLRFGCVSRAARAASPQGLPQLLGTTTPIHAATTHCRPAAELQLQLAWRRALFGVTPAQAGRRGACCLAVPGCMLVPCIA
jgi:hypothetical protein